MIKYPIKACYVDEKGIDLDSGIVPFILSERIVDHDSEVIEPNGIELGIFEKNPVFLWAHDMRGRPPIGRVMPESLKKTKQRLTGKVKFDIENDPFAAMVFQKYANGFLNAGSIRFIPTDYSDKAVLPGQKGATITKSILLEFSSVAVPANPAALAQKGFTDDLDKDERGQEWLKELNDFFEDDNFDHTPEGWIDRMNKVEEPQKNIVEKVKTLSINEEDIKNIQPKIIIGYEKDFDVDKEELQASVLEYEWASRFCGCAVKDLYMVTTGFNYLWKGSFFSAINELTSDWELHDTRNLTRKGAEEPPVHEVIEVNSKETMTFLTEGISFWISEDCKLAIKVEPSWNRHLMTVYADKKYREKINEFINNCWEWANKNHKLRGEAFSLSGDFLKRKSGGWNEVFLPDKNKKPLQRIVKLLEERRDLCANRGIILMGPPGTGKTLSGRIMMNQSESTFIWISAKDFWHLGSIGGLSKAFNIAKILSPSILFIEDVDNWMSGTTVDLFKTEMDGIEQTSGIITMITTNFPQRMPDALIDRPGRFHDVLEFDLPGDEERKQMLKTWVSDADDKTISNFVKKTEGYSGAHLYELAQYVKIICEEDEINVDEGLERALNKIREQRELINENQLAGSNYRKQQESNVIKDIIRDTIYEALGKTIVPFQSYPLADENTFWEENIPYMKGHFSDCFAWFNYRVRIGKFPHHTPIDGEVKTVWRGVAKAMVDLFKDDSLSDDERKEVYEHLAKHYKEFDKEPPEFKDYSEEELNEITEKIIVDFSEEDEQKIIEQTIKLLKDKEPKE